jgi:hypothetical protein
MIRRPSPQTIRIIKGYALISTLLIGSFSIMFLLALGGSLIAVSRSAGHYKSKRFLDEAAEVGLDYAVRDMNKALTNGTASSFDITGTSMQTVKSLPSDYLACLLPGTSVQIRVRKLSDEDLLSIKDFSTLYRTEYGPSQTIDYDHPGLPPVIDCLRVAEVTASNGSFSRSIRAVLEPRFDGGDGSAPAQKQGLFPSAGMFANRNLSLNGNIIAQIHPVSTPLTGYSQAERGIDNPDNPATAEYDPSKNYRLDVQTNRFADIRGGAKIIGNLKVSNSPINAPSTVGIAEDGTKIYGRALTSSGTSDSLQGTAGDAPSSQDEVLAQADRDPTLGGTTFTNRQGINKYVPVSTSSQSELPQFIPSSVPTDSQAIDPYSSSAIAATFGTTRYVAVNSSQQAFRVNGLELTRTTDPTPTALSFLVSGSDSAAKIYIEGGAVMDSNGAPLPVLNIDSNMFRVNDSTSNPLQMQIYYGGTQEIRVNVTDGGSGIGRFDGIIYAPNAKVSITGKGNFNGSVVADDLQVSSTNPLTLNLITNLNDINATSVYGSKGLQPSTSVTAGGAKGYSPVTFERLSGKLVN